MASMKQSLRILLAVWFSLLILGNIFGDAPGEFVLNSEKNGVKVFTRKLEGSSIKEFKGVTTIKTSLTSLVALLDDTEAYPQWMHRVRGAKIVAKVNSHERISWTFVQAPWPVSDRDTVTQSRLVQDSKTKTVTIYLKGVPDQYPRQSGKVRVPALRGYWQFIPHKSGFITVIYQLLSDPGGSIPDAIANATVTDIPYHTLLNMHRLVKLDKYKGAKIPEIKELQ
ncbi:MAG: START domain-containing protein [Spirochaetes bacterium]|nr:START domain-containing protein [Spirochaetota bacterium]